MKTPPRGPTWIPPPPRAWLIVRWGRVVGLRGARAHDRVSPPGGTPMSAIPSTFSSVRWLQPLTEDSMNSSGLTWLIRHDRTALWPWVYKLRLGRWLLPLPTQLATREREREREREKWEAWRRLGIRFRRRLTQNLDRGEKELGVWRVSSEIHHLGGTLVTGKSSPVVRTATEPLRSVVCPAINLITSKYFLLAFIVASASVSI
jgi:hypothetical protein